MIKSKTHPVYLFIDLENTNLSYPENFSQNFFFFQIQQAQTVLAVHYRERISSGPGFPDDCLDVGRIRPCLKPGLGDGRMPGGAILWGVPERAQRNSGDSIFSKTLGCRTRRPSPSFFHFFQQTSQIRFEKGPNATSEASGR